MNIESAKYYQGEKLNSNGEIVSNGINIGITATIDEVAMSVPLDPNNRHYAELLKQVNAGTLTIKDAD